MADKEILDLITATTLNPTDWFHIKQGATDAKMVIGDILSAHVNSANPHSVTKAQVGLPNVLNVAQLERALNLSDIPNKATARTNMDVYSKAEIATQIGNHGNLTNNPHGVTKAQVGLANVNNYPTTDNPREDTSTKFASGKAVAILASELDKLLGNQTPKGAIMMWSPLSGAIPVGWAVCNGQSIGGMVTPNLIGKFIKYTEIKDAGVSGGSNSVTHTHSGTVAGHALTHQQMPAHQHFDGWGEKYSWVSPWGAALPPPQGGAFLGSGDTDGDNRYFAPTSVSGGDGVTVDTCTPHSHNLSIGDSTLTINPEHYTLVPIIKYI